MVVVADSYKGNNELSEVIYAVSPGGNSPRDVSFANIIDSNFNKKFERPVQINKDNFPFSAGSVSDIISDGDGGAIILVSGFGIRIVKHDGSLIPPDINSLLTIVESPGRFTGMIDPSITIDGRGGGIISWIQDNSFLDNRLSGVFARFFHIDVNNRISLSNIIRLNSQSVNPGDSLDIHGGLDITSDGDGGAIIVWQSSDSNEFGTFVRFLKADGTFGSDIINLSLTFVLLN